MIGARWADANVGRPVNAAHAQQNARTAVTVASKALEVGELEQRVEALETLLSKQRQSTNGVTAHVD